MENSTPQVAQPVTPQVPPTAPAKAPEVSGGPSRTGLYAIIILVILLLVGAGVVAIMYSQKSYSVSYTPTPSAYVSPTGNASPSASPINSQSDLNGASQTLDAQDTTQITNTLNQNTQDTSKF